MGIAHCTIPGLVATYGMEVDPAEIQASVVEMNPENMGAEVSGALHPRGPRVRAFRQVFLVKFSEIKRPDIKRHQSSNRWLTWTSLPEATFWDVSRKVAFWFFLAKRVSYKAAIISLMACNLPMW